MKVLISLLLCVTALAHGGDMPKQITKTSKKPLDVEAEVKALYVRLNDTDPEIRKQVDVLTADAHENYGGIFHAFAPKVVEWFPTESNWDIRTGSDMTGRFLVIQPIGYGRSRHAGTDTALVAEFEATYVSVLKPNPKEPDQEGDAVSFKLTITFLGFRDPDLISIKRPK